MNPGESTTAHSLWIPVVPSRDPGDSKEGILAAEQRAAVELQLRREAEAEAALSKLRCLVTLFE